MLELSWAAEETEVSFKSEIDKIAEITDPEMRIFTYINYAMRRFTERPTNFGQAYYNINPGEQIEISGTSPESVSDPEVRKEYEKRIRENDEKIRLHNLSARVVREATAAVTTAEFVALSELEEPKQGELIKLMEGLREIFQKYQ